jgi:hypothetical protein
MENKETFSVQIYLEPVKGTFNVYPLGSESITDCASAAIVDEYLKRFSEAWDELAKK